MLRLQVCSQERRLHFSTRRELFGVILIMSKVATRKNPIYGYTDSGHIISAAGELVVYNELKKSGYNVYKYGWPDFLAIKGDEVRFIEVKGPKGKLQENQARIIKVLHNLGINVEIIHTDV